MRNEEIPTLVGSGVDVGTGDEYAWIPDGCRYYAQAAERHDVPVRLETFEGGHGGIGSRAGEVMWPMFAAALDAWGVHRSWSSDRPDIAPFGGAWCRVEPPHDRGAIRQASPSRRR